MMPASGATDVPADVKFEYLFRCQQFASNNRLAIIQEIRDFFDRTVSGTSLSVTARRCADFHRKVCRSVRVSGLSLRDFSTV
jgi:hypothetical protein